MAREAYILKESALLSLKALKSLLMLVYTGVMLLLLPFRGRRRVSPVEKPGGCGYKDEKQLECHRKGAVVRVPTKMVSWKSAAIKAVDLTTTTRRELAIKRVVEDVDQSWLRKYWLLRTKRGDTLFTQCWTPANVKIRGLVLIMHGLNEHCGRYSDFAKHLNANGYKVYGMDWIGLNYLDAYMCDKVTCEAPVYKPWWK